MGHPKGCRKSRPNPRPIKTLMDFGSNTVSSPNILFIYSIGRAKTVKQKITYTAKISTKENKASFWILFSRPSLPSAKWLLCIRQKPLRFYIWSMGITLDSGIPGDAPTHTCWNRNNSNIIGSQSHVSDGALSGQLFLGRMGWLNIVRTRKKGL